MKHVKFVMSKGDPITVDEPQALRILNSPQQLLMVMDKNGQWTRKTINKAHIVDTLPDLEADRAYNERQARFTIKLSMPEISDEQRARNCEALRRMKEKIFGKKFASKRLDISRG
jgi:hypothetical protein